MVAIVGHYCPTDALPAERLTRWFRHWSAPRVIRALERGQLERARALLARFDATASISVVAERAVPNERCWFPDAVIVPIGARR
jgi:hypothetical protein